MVPDCTFSVETTGSVTGVDTMLVGAGLQPVALIVDDTLWSAVGGGSNVSSLAGAHWPVTEWLAG